MSVPNGEDKFFRQVLPNGLKVIFEKRDTPTVSVLAATKFGSGYESANLKGIAHLIEHTVFRGTKTKTGEQVTSMVENKGGSINAFTADEITAYYAKMRSNHFEIAMDAISDIMLHPSLMKKDMDMEKKIVLQEIKTYHDSPAKHALMKLNEQLYSPPFGLSGHGTPETLGNITKNTLNKYHSIYYSPSHTVVSIVGKAEVDHIWNLSRKYFMKKQVQRQINKREELKISEGPFGNFVEQRKELDQAHIALGYSMPTRKDRLRYAAEVLNTILGSGFSSRLFQQIREKRGLAYVVYSKLNQEIDYSNGYIYMGTDKSKSDAAIKMALAEIKKLQKVDAKEVEQAKERLMGERAIESEDSEAVALRLLEEELNGEGKEYYKYPERISAVTLEEVRQVAKISKIASSIVLPE